jgi:glycine cleavage system H protein
MSEKLLNIYCSKSHEYISVDGNKARIGITEHAAEQLGDVVFVELPEVGATLKTNEIFGTIESVKAASEIYMPIGGTVTAINTKLEAEPELVNESPYSEGWLMEITDFNLTELKNLMSHEEYLKYAEEG